VAVAARAFDVRHTRRNVHVDAWTQVEMAASPDFGLERTASASPRQLQAFGGRSPGEV
jgi:hypothetical protein